MTTPPAAAERVDRVTELMDSLVAGVAQLTTSDDWLRWLDVARRFHSHRTGAILTQRPDATQVAGYQRWTTLGRQVRRGERAIRILAPCPRRRTVVDDTTGEEETVTRVAGWKVASVFDITQTDGPPLPELPVWHLEGTDPALVRHQLAAVIRAEHYTFRLGAMPTGHERANGITNFTTPASTRRPTGTGTATAPAERTSSPKTLRPNDARSSRTTRHGGPQGLSVATTSAACSPPARSPRAPSASSQPRSWPTPPRSAAAPTR
jgi:hypothetical protein